MAAGKTLSPHAGHRARLRERFRRGGFEGMLDYEVMELVLTMLIPMRDVKPLAKRLMNEFGSIADVLDAAPEQLAAVPGLGEVTATNLKILRSLVPVYLERKCRNAGDLLITPELAANFARAKIGAGTHESYLLIYLDSCQRLIDCEMLTEGTVDRVFFYVRNVVEGVLRHRAAGVILVHNHPSGECRPSPEDVDVTRQLYSAFAAIGINFPDHLIVSREDCFSFTASGMMNRIRAEEEQKKKKKEKLL